MHTSLQSKHTCRCIQHYLNSEDGKQHFEKLKNVKNQRGHRSAENRQSEEGCDMLKLLSVFYVVPVLTSHIMIIFVFVVQDSRVCITIRILHFLLVLLHVSSTSTSTSTFAHVCNTARSRVTVQYRHPERTVPCTPVVAATSQKRQRCVCPLLSFVGRPTSSSQYEGLHRRYFLRLPSNFRSRCVTHLWSMI